MEKPNELNDIHAMFAKVCAYLMHKEERLKPGPALDQLKENWKKMEDFCGMLAAKDCETLSLGQADAGHEKGAKKKSHPPTDVIFSINKIHFYIETELFLTDSCASPKNFRLHCTSLNA